jgi:hypothetical protein
LYYLSSYPSESGNAARARPYSSGRYGIMAESCLVTTSDYFVGIIGYVFLAIVFFAGYYTGIFIQENKAD